MILVMYILRRCIVQPDSFFFFNSSCRFAIYSRKVLGKRKKKKKKKVACLLIKEIIFTLTNCGLYFTKLLQNYLFDSILKKFGKQKNKKLTYSNAKKETGNRESRKKKTNKNLCGT